MRVFDVVLLPRVHGKTLDTIKQAATRVARRTPDSVTIQEIFDECTIVHKDLHRNRGFLSAAGAAAKDTVRQVDL